MPQVSEREFEQLTLRVHEFLAGVPGNDIWAVELPRPRAGNTLDEFLRVASGRLFSPIVRALLNLWSFVDRLFGWDSTRRRPFLIPAGRLTAADRASSLAPVIERDRPFRAVYRFENEQPLLRSVRATWNETVGAIPGT